MEQLVYDALIINTVVAVFTNINIIAHRGVHRGFLWEGFIPPPSARGVTRT